MMFRVPGAMASPRAVPLSGWSVDSGLVACKAFGVGRRKRVIMVFVVLVAVVALVLGALFYDYVWAPRALRVVREGTSIAMVERALGPPDCREATLREAKPVDRLHFSRGVFRGTYLECLVHDGVVVECSSHREDLFWRIDG